LITQGKPIFEAALCKASKVVTNSNLLVGRFN